MVLGPRDAQAVDDEVSAARLYLELSHQDGQPSLSSSQQADTKAAMRNLRTRFPNVAEVARSETPDELGGLPQHLRARQKAMRDEAGHDVNATRAEREQHRKSRGRDTAPKAPKPASKPGPGGTRSARRGVDATLARAAGKGRRRARRTYRQATPGAVTNWGRLAMQSIGTAVGLSLLYLLLRDAESKRGGGAVGIAANGFAQAVTRLLSPAADVFGSAAVPVLVSGPTDPLPAAPSPAGGPTPLPPKKLPGRTPTTPNRLATYPH